MVLTSLIDCHQRQTKSISRDVSNIMKTRNAINATKHGKCYSPTYRSWQNMKSRCISANNPAYANYGGNGISVCSRWMSFENFYEDMGERPAGTSLDRIDNDKGYSHENCRWATSTQQNRNRRNVKLFDGKTLTELTALHGVKPSTVRQRYFVYGWPIERCVS
jgi:hypothetical protein